MKTEWKHELLQDVPSSFIKNVSFSCTDGRYFNLSMYQLVPNTRNVPDDVEGANRYLTLMANNLVVAMNQTEAQVEAIKDLWVDYKERLAMYDEGLTHAGDVIGRRKFLINCGETVPEIILNGYKCPRDQA